MNWYLVRFVTCDFCPNCLCIPPISVSCYTLRHWSRLSPLQRSPVGLFLCRHCVSGKRYPKQVALQLSRHEIILVGMMQIIYGNTIIVKLILFLLYYYQLDLRDVLNLNLANICVCVSPENLYIMDPTLVQSM